MDDRDRTGNPGAPPAGSAGSADQRDGNDPVIPDRSHDDRDEGWGDVESDQDERLRRERPPHW